MEGRVSNVEICNLAYTGKFEELKKCVLSDSSLAAKTDQVCGSVGAYAQWLALCYTEVYPLIQRQLSYVKSALNVPVSYRTAGLLCTGLVQLVMWISCSSYWILELKWISKMM